MTEEAPVEGGFAPCLLCEIPEGIVRYAKDSPYLIMDCPRCLTPLVAPRRHVRKVLPDERISMTETVSRLWGTGLKFVEGHPWSHFHLHVEADPK